MDFFPFIRPDYRLNPVLRKACKPDIPKFCQNILDKSKDDIELEGRVISCLKLKYADQVCSSTPHSAVLLCDYDWVCVVVTVVELCVQRLSPDCEDQIRVILQESALDYRLDPQLQMQCTDEVGYSSSFLQVSP